MIFSPSLKKSIAISFFWHIVVFSIFSFSFGKRIFKIDYPSVYFWGVMLISASDTHRSANTNIGKIAREKVDTLLASRPGPQRPLIFRYSLKKPPVSLRVDAEKASFTAPASALLPIPQKKKPVFEFYPLIPYHFTLYFRDRQVAHIELLFKINASGKMNSVAVKRKISSGNLETDLLVMRYINHYLFLQQAMFPADSWQEVKIDFSAKKNN